MIERKTSLEKLDVFELTNSIQEDWKNGGEV